MSKRKIDETNGFSFNGPSVNNEPTMPFTFGMNLKEGFDFNCSKCHKYNISHIKCGYCNHDVSDIYIQLKEENEIIKKYINIEDITKKSQELNRQLNLKNEELKKLNEEINNSNKKLKQYNLLTKILK